MRIIEMRLRHFFTDRDRPYKVNGIEIDYSSEFNSVVVCSKAPGFEVRKNGVCVELLSDHSDLCDFIYEYLITQSDDLTGITKDLMLKRFQVGRCDLVVSLDPDMEYCLEFRKKGFQLIAKDNDDNQHEVPQYFKTPEELVMYTNEYFEKLAMSSS